MKFILILTLITLNGNGTTVTTAEFNTADACQKAAAAWVSLAGRADLHPGAICTEKGEAAE